MATRTRRTRPIDGQRLLLDEMLSGAIAEQLRARRHDVAAVVEDNALISLPDEDLLVAATEAGRAIVTANIKDFVPLDQRWKAAGQSHAGIVLVPTKTCPQDRAFIGALVDALDRLLRTPGVLGDDVVFLQR